MWVELIALMVAGFMAGAINTLAGGGSAITLAIFGFLGLSPTEANGTNRLGVLFQSAMAFTTFRRAEKRGFPIRIILMTIIGGVLGALMAVKMPESLMALVLVFSFFLILLKFLSRGGLSGSVTNKGAAVRIASLLAFLTIGAYGGMVQAGVGIFLLSAMVLLEGFEFNEANQMKSFIVLMYSIPAIIIFAFNGDVNWYYGLVVGGGQVIGANLSAQWAVKSAQSERYIRYLVIIVLILAIIKYLSFFWQ